MSSDVDYRLPLDVLRAPQFAMGQLLLDRNGEQHGNPFISLSYTFTSPYSFPAVARA